MTIERDYAAAVSRTTIEDAWERFVGGADRVYGVSPSIVRSWYRCREQYQVDPSLAEAPRASAQAGQPAFVDDAVFVELGGSAYSVANELADTGAIVAVADGAGRVLAVWGDYATVGRGQASNLAPLSHWAEGACGTNGIGTALESSGPVVVRGAEHWCRGFHDWAAAGVTVRDAVTDEPAAVLSVARWKDDLPLSVVDWLSGAVTGVEARLREHAMDSAWDLIDAFGAARRASREGLLAVDRAGRVIVADEQAGSWLEVPACTPAVCPTSRPDVGLSAIASLVSGEVDTDPSWVGSCTIRTPVTDEAVPMQISPVVVGRRHIGSIFALGAVDGSEELVEDRSRQVGRLGYTPPRIVAAGEGRTVLLRPTEVCFAEADGSDVWLATDRGQLHVTTSSLDRLEGQFRSGGFLRVHRRFVVNLNRVREVERGVKGELLLTVDNRSGDSVPVSRRNSAMVRRVLGL